MSADPLAVHAPGQADLNVYAYVHGAVLKNTDPVGLCTDGVDCSKMPDAAPQEGAATAAGSTPNGALKSDREVIQGVVDKMVDDSNRQMAEADRGGCGPNASCPEPDRVNEINNSSNLFNRPPTEGQVIKEQQAIAEENRLMAYERGGVQSVPSPVDAAGSAAIAGVKLASRMTLRAPDIRVAMAEAESAGSGSQYVNLASAKRTEHVLTGDATGGGHLWPGAPGKTPFPEGWSGERVMHEVSDIATDPALTWVQQTGRAGSMFTRAGDPSRFVVVGERGGLQIKVVLEPAGEGIITAHPLLPTP